MKKAEIITENRITKVFVLTLTNRKLCEVLGN